ncbi:MAG: class I SAM-dependent methyltransferase [Bacteroidota bacterium]
MKKPLDKFSEQSKSYKKYRPTYPKELYDDILKLVKTKDVCWDCGTGNGQVATVLSSYFNTVYATDLSHGQITKAPKKANIIYKVERAETTRFNDDQFDLITVAQAIHWFDFTAFNKEVRRVCKNEGILSVWGYGLLKISEPIDVLVHAFYHHVVGPYWDKERRHVENEYKSIPLVFDEIQTKNQKSIKINWTLEHLEGYFNSWSSVRNYMRDNGGRNPVDQLMKELKSVWGKDALKEIEFPIFLRVGRIKK